MIITSMGMLPKKFRNPLLTSTETASSVEPLLPLETLLMLLVKSLLWRLFRPPDQLPVWHSTVARYNKHSKKYKNINIDIS